MLISGRIKRHVIKRKIIFPGLTKSIIAAVTGILCLSGPACASQNHQGVKEADTDTSKASNIEFNADFIRGIDVDISRFSQGNPVEPGTYPVLIRLNGKSRGNFMINFVADGPERNARACFTAAELRSIGIKPDSDNATNPDNASACSYIENFVKDGNVSYNSGDYEMDISVPQLNMIKYPRGYVDPSLWDKGVTSAFFDYNVNHYNSARRGGNRYSNKSTNIGWLAGLNVGGWRIRKRVISSWTNEGRMKNESIFSYAETDVDTIKSRLTVGDSNTHGDIFDGYSLRGIYLRSENRMLPEAYRNFVPVLRGIAETNARVRIIQRDKTIYETVVPPGTFELDDIGAMGYGGDLKMVITEADGREHTQNIPFSAPPMLLHKGIHQYGLAAGQFRDNRIRKKPGIFQGIYQYGLSNILTPYTGFQLARHYRAVVAGSAVNTSLGGFSADVTHASSSIGKHTVSKGNSFRIGYSKYLAPTDTDVVLAAYRYSSKGYYTLPEATLARYGSNHLYDVNYRVRNRLTMNIGQRLWNSSYLSLSGATYSYWDSRPSVKQFAVTFMQPMKHFTFSVTAQREFSRFKNAVNTFLLSISVPLGRNMSEHPPFSSLYTSLMHDTTNSTSFQLNASGSQGEQNELNYAVGTSTGKYHHGQSLETLSGNISYRSPIGRYGMTALADNHASRQFSLSASGSLVAHSGGVTLGPQIGEAPFAIVEAKGATGARILNGYGTQFDWNGYAIMPSLTPYRENNVTVNSYGALNEVDILENQHTVIPRMGSSLYVRMKTIVGTPVILIVRDEKGDYLPVGSAIYDKNGTEKSLIGQSGMAFLRGWQAEDEELYVGMNSAEPKCHIPADKKLARKIKANTNDVIQLEVTCIH
ncbi:fimbria/pilus outer membrane usher protein [[Erwinia] mediterraneensis]|uniref:fimbria/pilus outer membrane usher protein n=1 Tax=[Erwinia] mediterraneensis TaxID=2161819 RepID=UPI0010304D44|nr:fimbria/pilus outer membrane usher protein [[Erwinia] mediterraneensis]